MNQVLTITAYSLFALAVGVTLMNVVYAYLTLKTGRYHSSVFLVTTILALIGCRVLSLTPHGCRVSTIVIFAILDFATPVVARGLFTLIGIGTHH